MNHDNSSTIILEALEAKVVFAPEVAMTLHQEMLEDAYEDREDELSTGDAETDSSIADSNDGGPKGLTLNNHLSLSDAALIELIHKIRNDPNFNPKHLNLRNLKLTLKGLQILANALPELGNVESVSLSKANAKMPLGKKLSYRLETLQKEKDATLSNQPEVSLKVRSPFSIKPPKPK